MGEELKTEEWLEWANEIGKDLDCLSEGINKYKGIQQEEEEQTSSFLTFPSFTLPSFLEEQQENEPEQFKKKRKELIELVKEAQAERIQLRHHYLSKINQWMKENKSKLNSWFKEYEFKSLDFPRFQEIKEEEEEEQKEDPEETEEEEEKEEKEIPKKKIKRFKKDPSIKIKKEINNSTIQEDNNNSNNNSVDITSCSSSSSSNKKEIGWIWKLLNQSLTQQRHFLKDKSLPTRHSRKEALDDVEVEFPLQLPLIMKTQYLGIQMEFELYWVDDIWFSKKEINHPRNISFVRIPALPNKPSEKNMHHHIEGKWYKHISPSKPMSFWFTSLTNTWRKVASMIRGECVSASGALKFFIYVDEKWISISDLHQILEQQNEERQEEGIEEKIPLFRNPHYGSLENQFRLRSELTEKAGNELPEFMRIEFPYVPSSNKKKKKKQEEEEEENSSTEEEDEEERKLNKKRKQNRSSKNMSHLIKAAQSMTFEEFVLLRKENKI